MSDDEKFKRGPLAWMASNSVAANLLMVLLLVGGFVIGSQVKQEVFPEFDLGTVIIRIIYPGASPAEVEQGVVLAIEEAVRGIDGVKEISGSANEGVGSVIVDLLTGTDSNRALGDIKSAVDRVTSLPVDIERPTVSLATTRSQVISLVVYGEQSELTLRRVAEKARDELLEDPRITVVELAAVRPYEISVEISQETLRSYNLTLEHVANVIRRASVEIPGGGVKTSGGEILLRTTERRDAGVDFARIAVVSRPDGTVVRLGDLANIVDGFAELDQRAYFDGSPAAMVEVYRIGDETPLEVAAAVHEYVAKKSAELPAGVGVATWSDRSEMYRDRMGLLMRNGYLGLILVLLVLGLFLEPRLAFWVTMGIPISFIGSLLFMAALDVSINMISLFAFIVTLGIVVDDAIVVGEAIFHKRQQNMGFLRASIEGVREVAMPVTFSILTTIAAFSPLLFVPGTMGKFFMNIPMVVIAVLLISLIESLVVLPAHLAHVKAPKRKGPMAKLLGLQRRFSDGLERFINTTYKSWLHKAITRRHVTLAIGTMVLLIALGYTIGGRIHFAFMPRIDSDKVTATATLPFGAPIADTEAISKRMKAAADAIIARNAPENVEEGAPTSISRGVFSIVGGMQVHGGPAASVGSAGSHLTQVTVYLVQSDLRDLGARDFADAWRREVGDVPGIESLTFKFSIGPGATAPIDIELSHRDLPTLEAAATRLADEMEALAGTLEIDDGFALGKEQLDFRLRPEARSLGLTEMDLARQVRSSFYGVEAVRQQRNRDEVRTYVRLPEAERRSEYDVERLILRTPAGGEIPVAQAATTTRGRAYTQIKRVEGRRVVRVSSEVMPTANADEIIAALKKDALPRLLADVPGLSWAPGGQQKEKKESMEAMGFGFLLAMIAIYGLLAVPFRSYVQPAIVMIAIPFGFVGALLGHIVMGYDLSMISMMGIVALSGVVVNDSLVLIVAINQFRSDGMSLIDAVLAGGVRRFRPILLTSLTTFFGLMPMILEPSMQARFLVPMALSLGFGILSATVICLLLVPAAYLVVEDIRAIFAPKVSDDSDDELAVTNLSAGPGHLASAESK